MFHTGFQLSQTYHNFSKKYLSSLRTPMNTGTGESNIYIISGDTVDIKGCTHLNGFRRELNRSLNRSNEYIEDEIMFLWEDMITTYYSQRRADKIYTN